MAAKVEPLQDQHGNAPPLVGAVQTDGKAEQNAHGLAAKEHTASVLYKSSSSYFDDPNQEDAPAFYTYVLDIVKPRHLTLGLAALASLHWLNSNGSPRHAPGWEFDALF